MTRPEKIAEKLGARKQASLKTAKSTEATFPVDLSQYHKVAIDPFSSEHLTSSQREALAQNVALCRGQLAGRSATVRSETGWRGWGEGRTEGRSGPRAQLSDALVFFTACGGASGYGGHTGGAFDMMPEVCLLDSFFRARPDKFVPTFFDEAGHRVATQYLFAVLHGQMAELGLTEGIAFSSGRLGHMWGHVNGVALAERERLVCCFSSDGSQMPGNTAEAARMAVAQQLNVKLFIDDNDTTIAGHPSSYMKGFNVGQTLQGHGLRSEDVQGEELDALYGAMRRAVLHDGPYAVVIKRSMCPGVRDLEGSNEGHDAMPLKHAVQYLQDRGLDKAAGLLQQVPKTKDPQETYLGAGKFGAPRQVFGESVVRILKQLDAETRKRQVLVIDNDLEGSCGLKKVGDAFPEVYVKGGIMERLRRPDTGATWKRGTYGAREPRSMEERSNFGACGGFGSSSGRQAVFGTFAAFQEMILSEVCMARLNHCNVLCHFSHSGVDDMSDNTCHFGVNNFFSDLGLKSQHAPEIQLFFPADVHQTAQVVDRTDSARPPRSPRPRGIGDRIFWQSGLRFIYTTRSKVPEILDEHGQPFFAERKFELGHLDVTGSLRSLLLLVCSGKDDLVLGDDHDAGYIVSYGDALYRALDAARQLRLQGLKDMMELIGKSQFVLVVESQNLRTGLGLRLGTWLLERQLTPRFARLGTHREGCYDSGSIVAKVLELNPGHSALKEPIKGRAVARPLGAHV
eukprot:g19223.t1